MMVTGAEKKTTPHFNITVRSMAPATTKSVSVNRNNGKRSNDDHNFGPIILL